MTTDARAVRLLLVTCGEPEPSIAAEHGGYAAWFRRAFDPRVTLVEVDARVDPPDASWLRGLDGVVISGSPHSVYDPLPWIAPLEALIREAVDGYGLPLLGVCFGHQLLAQAYGGAVVRNPRGREIGTVAVELTAAGRASPLWSDLPAPVAVHATHCDTVARAPAGAVLLGHSALDECQAFAYGSAYGVQFHPEVTADIIRGYLRVRAPRIASEGLDPDALLRNVVDTQAGPQLLARFAQLAACYTGRDATAA